MASQNIKVSRVIFGAVNHGATAVATVGAAVASLPASSMFDNQPSKPTRIASTDPGLTWIETDHLSQKIFRLFHLVNPNWSKTAKFRFRGSNLYPIVQRLYPDAITKTNLTGLVTDVDEAPEAGGTDWLLATGNVNTTVLATFPTPSRNLLIGTDDQRFRIRVRKNNAGASNPTLEIRLKEAGVLKRVLATGIVVSADSTIGVTFNASELAAISGLNCEIELAATASATSTVEYGAIEWNASLGGLIHDSGRKKAFVVQNGFGTLPWGALEWGGALPQEEAIINFNRAATYVSDFDVVCRYWRTDIEDSSNVDGAIDIGEYFIGPGFIPSRNPSYGVEVWVENDSTHSRVPGGPTFSSLKDGYLVMSMQFSALSESEVFNGFLRDIDLRLRGGAGLVCVLFPDKPDYYPFTSIFGRQRKAGAIKFTAFRRQDRGLMEIEQVK